MSWGHRHMGIQPGDTVSFSRRWIEEHDRAEGHLDAAKGLVIKIERTDGRTLASVAWDRPGLPDMVNTLNLSKIRQCGRG